MKYRCFGATGIKVSEIGFGGSRIGGVFAGAEGRREALAALERALDHGITFFDTADMYSQGESETLLGKALRSSRERVVIASKGGFTLPGRRKLAAQLKPLLAPLARRLGIRRSHVPAGASGALAQDFRPEYLAQAVEASLRRLGTDYIDLYQLHSPPPSVFQSLEWIQPLDRMKQQGKIRYYGIAADSVDDAIACLFLDIPDLASVQLPFGLLDLEALDTLLPLAERRGVGVISRGCFGGGLLKESLTEPELRAKTPKWPRILAIRQAAQGMGRPVLEAALQFGLRASGPSVTILGMHKAGHVEQNLSWYSAKPLSDGEFEQLVEAANVPDDEPQQAAPT